MWQWSHFNKVLASYSVAPLALHQSSFGMDYPKPTRLLIKGATVFPDFCDVGPPTYNDGGSYIGPRPLRQGYTSMATRTATGPFMTTGTEQWPARMCQWIAFMLLESCTCSDC